MPTWQLGRDDARFVCLTPLPGNVVVDRDPGPMELGTAVGADQPQVAAHQPPAVQVCEGRLPRSLALRVGLAERDHLPAPRRADPVCTQHQALGHLVGALNSQHDSIQQQLRAGRLLALGSNADAPLRPGCG